MQPNEKKELEKKRDQLKNQIAAIDKELAAAEKFDAVIVEARKKLDVEVRAAEQDVQKVYKEEADKLKAAMMDDARSALKE